MTVQQLANAAMGLLGHLEPGFTPSTDHTNVAVATLNSLLESLAAEGVMVYAIIEDGVVSSGSQAYTWGSAGNITTTKPIRLKSGYFLINNIQLPFKFVSAEEWAQIVDPTSVGYPEKAYYNYAQPTGTLSLWPIPTSTGVVHVFSYKQLQSVVDASTTLALPPGYEEMLQYNLALALAPKFRRMPAPDVVVALAASSKAALARLNAEILGPMIGGGEPQ